MGGPSGKRSIGFSVNVLAFYGVCIATGRLCILDRGATMALYNDYCIK